MATSLVMGISIVPINSAITTKISTVPCKR